MKKFLIGILICVSLLLLAGLAHADDYTVALTTCAVKGSTTTFAGAGYPLIADGLKIDKIILANSGDTMQTINFYDTATSTSAASVALTVVLSSTGTVQIDYPYHNPLTLRNMAAIKSDTATTVNLNMQYR